MALELFDKVGNIVVPSEAQIAAAVDSGELTPERRTRLFALIAAHAQEVESDAEHLAATKDLADAVQAAGKAADAFRAANPPRSFLDEWKANKAARK